MLRRQNSVLLAYYEAEHVAYGWAVTKDSFRVHRIQVSQNELETLADTYRNEIDQHTSLEDSPAQQRLYQLLVKPVQDLIPRDGHVILVSDSALYRINFECLISDQGRRHYWIEDAEIENASSIDLLLYGRHGTRSSKGVLLIGDPEQEDPQYPRLPHAADEMASVERQFTANQVQKLSGRAATPDAYASIHPERFRFLEFAAHGTANSSNPLDSAVILSRGKNSEFKLFAGEIEKHKLNSELVTISACYGGGTARTSSEGLLGLQSAFLRAGAHQVIAGLWDVDDQSAPLLMGGTYQGVVKGKSAASALRAAKLKILSPRTADKAPYYWGALQLYVGA
jgi:CHAT domain-containing protein